MWGYNMERQYMKLSCFGKIWEPTTGWFMTMTMMMMMMMMMIMIIIIIIMGLALYGSIIHPKWIV